VHLTRKPDAGDLIGVKIPGRKGFADSNSAGTPPVLRLLLGPADLRGGERLVLLSRGCNYTAGLIDDECSCTASSYIDSE